jgi:hypothetical protein
LFVATAKRARHHDSEAKHDAVDPTVKAEVGGPALSLTLEF